MEVPCLLMEHSLEAMELPDLKAYLLVDKVT